MTEAHSEAENCTCHANFQSLMVHCPEEVASRHFDGDTASSTCPFTGPVSTGGRLSLFESVRFGEVLRTLHLNPLCGYSTDRNLLVILE